MVSDLEIEKPLKSPRASWPAPAIALLVALIGLVLNRHGGGWAAMVVGALMLLAVAILTVRRLRAS